MQVQAYLSFEGRCEEAFEFYKGAVGAEVIALMRFKEVPESGMAPPGCAEKIMHGCIRIGETSIMASDGRCAGQPDFQGISLAITVNDDAEAQRVFSALADGGQVQMPLDTTFFASQFGMVADRFGVTWMVLSPLPNA